MVPSVAAVFQRFLAGFERSGGAGGSSRAVAPTVSRRRHAALLAAAAAMLLGALAPAPALGADTAYFARALRLGNGTLAPAGPGASYLDAGPACAYVQAEWGWRGEDCARIDRIVFDYLPSVANILVFRPNADGHVRFDDWQDANRDRAIESIWQETAHGLRARGHAAGMTVQPGRWRIYPTLDAAQARLSYAIQFRRDDSAVLYVRVTQFDRGGYVSFLVTPSRPDMTDRELQNMIDDVLAFYRPYPRQGYADFRDGDARSVVGPVGVLASLMGVQHAESAIAVAVADALRQAREFWYLSFLSIALFAWRIFRRSDAASEA